MRRSSPSSLLPFRCLRLGAALALLAGCGDGPPATTDAGMTTAGTHLVFAPTAGTMDFGAIPFPDDRFDLAYSVAVMHHIAAMANQRR